MRITRTSIITGTTRTMDLPVTSEQILRHQAGDGLLQDIFPHLSPADREFIKTGITDDEWQTYVARK